jgi:hypothetical protein
MVILVSGLILNAESVGSFITEIIGGLLWEKQS